ncbi:hypothetical protein SMC26_29560 [Actinomadura fulvescens]|uniref:MBL fold metallo-hydrolase n=1 Tax=Actinomadura fulvescens TaxID=46160 RepID=A0ABN3QKC8_9ACTN
MPAPDLRLPTAQKPGLFAPGGGHILASRCGDLIINPDTCLWNLAGRP